MNDEANIPAVIEISLEDFDHHNPQRSDSLKHCHKETHTVECATTWTEPLGLRSHGAARF